MTKKLTLEDRHFINMYCRQLTCTLLLRFAIDKFINQIELTPEEIRKFDVKIDITDMRFECNDPEYTVDYEEFPPEVIKAIENYIKYLDNDKNSKNEMLQKSFKYFRKII